MAPRRVPHHDSEAVPRFWFATRACMQMYDGQLQVCPDGRHSSRASNTQNTQNDARVLEAF